MKKIFVCLLFVSHFVCSSQQNGSVVSQVDFYEQDVQQKRVELGTSRTHQDIQKTFTSLHARKNECDVGVKSYQSDKARIDEQVAVLQQQLNAKNKEWMDRNSNMFSPDKHQVQSRAALKRFQNLSSAKQLSQAAESALVPIGERVIEDCTPEGIEKYWRSKINGNLSREQGMFEQHKCSDLAAIHNNRQPIVSNILQFIEHKKFVEVQENNFQYYANQYGFLYCQNAELVHRAATEIQMMGRRFSVNRKIYKSQQIKQSEQAEKKRLQKEIETQQQRMRQIEDDRKMKLLLKQASDEAESAELRKAKSDHKAKKDAELAILKEQERQAEKLKLQQDQVESSRLEAERKQQAQRIKDQQKNARKKEIKLRKQAKEVEEDAFLDSIILATPERNHKADAHSLLQNCIASKESVSNASKALRIVPFRDALDNETHEYGSSLAVSGKYSLQETEQLIVTFKQQQEQRV